MLSNATINHYLSRLCLVKINDFIEMFLQKFYANNYEYIYIHIRIVNV